MLLPALYNYRNTQLKNSNLCTTKYLHYAVIQKKKKEYYMLHCAYGGCEVKYL